MKSTQNRFENVLMENYRCLYLKEIFYEKYSVFVIITETF